MATKTTVGLSQCHQSYSYIGSYTRLDRTPLLPDETWTCSDHGWNLTVLNALFSAGMAATPTETKDTLWDLEMTLVVNMNTPKCFPAKLN